jgi:hypothetical protein
MKTKQKNIDVKLDQRVSLLVEFNSCDRTTLTSSPSCIGEDSMFFHIADGQYGLEWSPTKKAITKLIATLQKIEGMMTNKTNKF